jgi:integrase
LNLNTHLADAVEFAFLTACRRQEVLGLHWSSVFLDAPVPHVVIDHVVEEAGSHVAIRKGHKTSGKTGDLGRTVYLVPRVIELLQERRASIVGPLVFPAPKAGGVWRPSGATQAVRRAAKRLGVTAGFHSRRHGSITSLLENGVPIEKVSLFAGHADVAMTSGTYGWVSQEIAKQSVVAVEHGLKGHVNVTSPLSPEVMMEAMRFAEKTGQRLDIVLSMLRGDGLAAE